MSQGVVSVGSSFGDVIVVGSLFDHNSLIALDGASLHVSNARSVNSVVVKNSVFSHNYASSSSLGSGVAVSALSGQSLVISHSTFANNTGNGRGAVFLNNVTCQVVADSCVFR